jgi:hypothetical protein
MMIWLHWRIGCCNVSYIAVVITAAAGDRKMQIDTVVLKW